MPIFSEDREARTEFYQQLQKREAQWWQTRQRLIMLKERHLFWFGDNSLMMWLLWQFVAYVAAALILMSAGKLFGLNLFLWEYLTIFALQTLFFLVMITFKGRLANRMQNSIDKADLAREQALNEMYILASDSIFPDIHAQSPISLQRIHERYDANLRLASLQCLLQKEVDAGRLLLADYQIEAKVLPPEIADAELSPLADAMIYKSLLAQPI
ncbi:MULTISPECIES: hypothetical protein [Psychrobacter]|uniref:hypothetical protein n=1 Tax=Psychrobacter TaxID=497 RepID=UPI00146EFE60|nr:MULTISPECIES: hypothetical protein [Psychrobacter]